MTCQARPDSLAGVEIQADRANRDDERIRAFGLLHEAHRRLDRAFTCSLERSCGISGPFFEVLLRIGRSPGGRLNMSELALQLGLTSGGTTRLVDRAVAAGLVERESCPSDRRVQWVVLSNAGEHKLDEALEVHLADLQHEFIDRLEPSELLVLERALDKLRAVDELPG
jgi:MarR family transcriptional regulator, 2-MHQ and catechol-resistance regulon repressor